MYFEWKFELWMGHCVKHNFYVEFGHLSQKSTNNDVGNDYNFCWLDLSS